ncbi:MAG: hypothetical protein ACN6OD_08355, partial [Alcaligenes sp.]
MNFYAPLRRAAELCMKFQTARHLFAFGTVSGVLLCQLAKSRLSAAVALRAGRGPGQAGFVLGHDV